MAYPLWAAVSGWRYTSLSVFIAIALIPQLLLCWLLLDVPLDDAYVYLRYAENFLLGHGLVFNPGDRVEGYSGYLWMLYVLAGAGLKFDVASFVQWGGIACHAVTTFVIWNYPRAFGRHEKALYPALLYGWAPATALWAIMGLETSLFTLLVVSSLLAYLRLDSGFWERFLVGLLLSMTALTRPEGIIIGLAIIGFETLWRMRTGHIRECIPWEYILPLTVFVAVLLARFSYYGEWWPNPVYLKVGANSTFWLRGLRYLLDFLNSFAGGALVIGLCAIHGVFARRDKAWWATWCVTLTMCGLVVGSGGNNWPFWRYAVPMAPLVAILLSELLADGFRSARALKTPWRLSVTVAMVILSLLPIYTTQRNSWSSGRLSTFVNGNRMFFQHARLYGYVLKETLGPGDSFAIAAVPFLSYFYGGIVFDTLGLVDRHIAHRNLPLGHKVPSHEKGDGEYILSLRPTLFRMFNYLAISDTPQGYPQRKDLYFVTDLEIHASPKFRSLYEPYNIFIPGVKKYLSFFKLRGATLRPIKGERLQALYDETIGRVRGIPTAKLRTLRRCEEFVRSVLSLAHCKVADRMAHYLSVSKE